MSFDVVVVGGGIGGLTVAALLSARGRSVCLLERQSQVGGCVGRVQYSGVDFEPGMGLYSDWGPGEIYDRIFSELKVTPPNTSLIADEVVVRIPGHADITLSRDTERFSADLRSVFAESAQEAVAFYEEVKNAAAASRNRFRRSTLRTRSKIEDLRRRFTRRDTKETSVADHLARTSSDFRGFIDAQLRALAHVSIDTCEFGLGSLLLDIIRGPLYSIEGGPAALAETLAASIRKSGGTVRLDAPVLRLAYDQSGTAVGVDLLSGETVFAKRAIVSNLTVWDTYGKLIGLNRTPPEIKRVITSVEGDGAYLIYALMEEAAADRLPSSVMLVAPTLARETEENRLPEFTFASNLCRSGKRTVTIKAPADVSEWFSYQSSESDYEELDQTALEKLWAEVHQALPELRGDIEVVETANPRTFYELTRRKLGMVLGRGVLEGFSPARYQTTVPNVFMVGDTVSAIPTLSSVSQSAIALAELIR